MTLSAIFRSGLFLSILSLSQPLHATGKEAGWREAIKGENLASGLPARFSPLPLYRKTMTGTEEVKLTDGQWQDEVLPHSKGAVGWSYINGPIHLLFDLGEEKEIGSIVARFQGGKRWDSIALPRKITISLSNDGTTYYEATSLTKVTGGESELAEKEPSAYFHIPEVGVNFVHPFHFDIQRKARFVALNVLPGVNSLFSDEVFIIKSEAPSLCRSLEGLQEAQFVAKGVQVRPKTGEFVVSTNVVTPNYFSIADMRTPAEKNTPVRTLFDLPKGITIQAGKSANARRDTTHEEGNRWIVEGLWDSQKPDWQNAEGPLYFTVDDGFKAPAEPVLTISTDAPDSAPNTRSYPIRFVEIPEVPPLKDFHVSLTWMNERDHAALYPGFLENFRKLGFTAIGTFPRNYNTPDDRAWLKEFAQKAKASGFDLIYNESPFHVMEQVDKKQDEIFNIVDGKRGKHLCQTYAGPFYKKEMERVRDATALIEPDYVIFDIELWYRSTQECKSCSRCQEAFRFSGMSDWDAFMITQGTRMIRDLSQAITLPGKERPQAGSYNFVPSPPVYHGLFSFPELFPAYLDFSMPVLYVRGDVVKVHEALRSVWNETGRRMAIPWLTGGTYGEYPAFKLEQQILEAALNGASGITYYRFQDHDPLDYYHQARALATLAPYETLLKEGALIPFDTQASALTTTAWGTKKEALLLIGNYTTEPATITPTLKGHTITRIKDAKTGETMAREAALNVAPDEQRLLWCTFE